MPVTVNIDRSKELTVLTWSGEITFKKLVDTLDQYSKDKPTRFELYDLRKLTGNQFSASEIHSLADYLQQHGDKRPPKSKTAIVAERDLDFGLSRMVALITDQKVPYQIEVFRSLGEARKWLAIP